MIQATYGKGAQSAAATGAMQYDTGQYIYLYGIPATLSGTMEIQFAYAGDAKAEGRMAQYDAAAKAWKARVPNKYLQRSRAVQVYLYQQKDENTAGTIYTAVFTPTQRAAPTTDVTEEEKNKWGELVEQITAKLAEMDSAIGRANTAAASVSAEIEQLDADKEAWEERIDVAEQAADAAQAAAEDAQENAHAANSKATGAHYWAVGPVNVIPSATGWAYDSTNDRYYQDLTVSDRMTAGMIPFVLCAAAGGNFPLCGCESLAGAIRLYTTNVPTITPTVTVYGLGVRT